MAKKTSNEKFWEAVKVPLCGDNFTGNLLYWLWKDLECVCCATYRGILFGSIATASVFVVAQWQMN